MMKILLFLLTLSIFTHAAERPNILWITSEDNSSHWLGCYGNAQAKTPTLDALAEQGTLFEHAYSNSPVCAVARSMILTGVPAPTMGTQHMRSRHEIPSRYKPNVSYLREAGYYCTNNSKTDYNFKGNDRSYWDESSRKAHYKNRPEGKPFFAIFNLFDSHESSLFKNKPTEPKRLKPDEVELPAYLPDLPAVRKDIALYHDRITKMDRKVGKLLDELEKRGLAEDTIVFYSSDHGGVLPRGKRYIEETGVKIPVIVRIPEKFRDLAPFLPNARASEPISFIDFTPTFLSLAGVEIPDYMPGRALMGARRVGPAEDEMEFLYADRFDEIYGMRRGLTDGKWKYIRNFKPHVPYAPFSFYQFRQKGWQAIIKAWHDGSLPEKHAAMWEAPSPTELLYDLSADPWEVNNLASDPKHAERLKTMRQRLKAEMVEVQDVGLIPEPMFDSLSGEQTIADYVQSDAFDVAAMAELAWTASGAEPDDLPALREAIASDDPVRRYWGVVGMHALGEEASSEVERLKALFEDTDPSIRVAAADALFSLGQEELGLEKLLAEAKKDHKPLVRLTILNVAMRRDVVGKLPGAKLKGNKGWEASYVNRFFDRVKAIERSSE